jgi:membrane peptidoglycan carboxypeptidase
MFAAVLSTEDGAFYHHSGYNLREIRTALIRDIEAGQPRFGASTITMQLARNLYLNRERTFARKIQEAVLTWYLESTLSKDEILTYYLNVIEFGPRIFGIRHAAMYYFGRQPDDLSPREAVFLAKLLPNPVQRHDSTFVEGELSPRWQTMLDRVLAVMRERRFITPAEYQAAVAERVVFFREGDPLPLHRTWRSRASSFDSWAEGEVDAPIDRWLEVDAEAEIPAPSELDDDFGDE